MGKHKSADRPLTVTTPLGPDALLLVGLTGGEHLSRLFHFQLDLVAERDTKVPFDALIGKRVTAHIRSPKGDKRHFSGFCSRISQGNRDPIFTSYQIEIVPELWFLTRQSQSRIFQGKNVPDILKEVLQGLNVQYEIQGTFHPRDYCVQYRETDFNFASRVMEEEGIYYYFKHEESSHTLILANTPQGHKDVPIAAQATYAALDDTYEAEDRVHTWQRTQELRSNKVILWDHCFEKPHKHLEAEKPIQSSVTAGTVNHTLQIGSSSKLELYDWPGVYAQRFDGVDPGGGDRASDIEKINEDNKRTVGIRMQEEAAQALVIQGASKLRQLTAGHKFKLEKHFDADGEYVLTRVDHTARMGGNLRSGTDEEFIYDNSFSCIPVALPYRPSRITPVPVVPGTQTAVVVGPKGEEIFTDKYGRVKVQFHWDRDGKNDEKSSCWVRVGQLAAGRRWGSSFWPRIGQEVIVDFLEGDADQPIIIGCVYNADQMPPYLGEGPDSKHKIDNKLFGFKSNTTDGGDGYNEWRFDDTKDKQQIFMHAEKDYDLRVKNDAKERIYGNNHHIVGWEKDGKKGGDLRQRVYEDHHIHIHKDRIEHVEGNIQTLVGKGEAASGGDLHLSIEKNRMEKIGADESLDIGGNRNTKIGGNDLVKSGKDFHHKAGMNIVLDAGMKLTIKGPGGFISIDATGITIQGNMVKINCGGSPTSAKDASPKAPTEAKPADPEVADDSKTGQKSC